MEEPFAKFVIIEYRDSIVQAKSLARYIVLADDTTPGVTASPTKRAVPSKDSPNHSPKRSPKQSPKREVQELSETISPGGKSSSPYRTCTKFGRSG